MVNSEYYKGLLERLRNDVRRKLLRNGQTVSSSIMTTLCHTSLLVWEFLSNKNIMVCPHPSYFRIWHHATSGSSPKSK